MKAMVLESVGAKLVLRDTPRPSAGPGQALVRVHACGICRTDLHVVDGDLREAKLPLIPGHQVVGQVEAVGPGVRSRATGDRVGIPWLGHTCGECEFCSSGMENLCNHALFTGYQVDGGLAQYCVADEQYCFPIPEGYPDEQAAPLLCAGLIGYRSYMMTGDAVRLGFYGFGAAAHILVQVATHQGREVYAFTRPGDTAAQDYARKLGAAWAGDSTQSPPLLLDAAIIFAPVGALVPCALRAVRKGGTVVCAGIHMSDIPAFPYSDLWEERVLRSVANLTRRDGEQFLALAPQIPVRTDVHVYALEAANQALDDLRAGRLTGAAVVRV